MAYPFVCDYLFNAAVIDMQEFHRQLAFDGIWLDMNECGQLRILKHGWPDAWHKSCIPVAGILYQGQPMQTR